MSHYVHVVRSRQLSLLWAALLSLLWVVLLSLLLVVLLSLLHVVLLSPLWAVLSWLFRIRVLVLVLKSGPWKVSIQHVLYASHYLFFPFLFFLAQLLAA